MTPLALGLVLGVAVFHVAWNYLTKSSQNKAGFLWISNAIFCVAYLPVYLLMGFSFDLPWQGWALTVFSGLGHALYYWALGRAYDAGDLSLVYPLARGSSVLFVAVLSVPLLGERLSALGVAGIATVLVGIFTLHIRPGSWKQTLFPSRTPGSMWALLTGVLVTWFSLVDKAGVGVVDPLAFTYLIFVATTLFFTPIAFHGGKGPIWQTWRAEKARLIGVGLLVPAAYGLILVAFTLAPAAYVVASREVRLVLGTLVGAFLLREGNVAYRIT
ncbi:MAG: EamA family transporter, partial [bacterium]